MDDLIKLPRHDFWGAGEPDCPKDMKASNGELHTMRCKACGDGWRDSSDICLPTFIAAIRKQERERCAALFDEGDLVLCTVAAQRIRSME